MRISRAFIAAAVVTKSKIFLKNARTDLLNAEIDVPLVKFNIELLDNVELEPKIYDNLLL